MAQRVIHPHRQSRLDIELDLMPTDRILQRWARSVGADLPAEQWSDAQSQALELPDDAAIEVDRLICQAPKKIRTFVHSWYRGQDSSSVIAKRFGLSRDGVYMYWRSVLWSYRQRFVRIPCVAALMQKHLEALQAA